MDTGYEFIGWDQLLYVWGPRVLGAAVILIAAYFIGKGLKWALARGVDKLPGAHHTNAEGDPKKSVGARLGEVVYWLVLLVGVVAALTVLQLGAVATPLNNLLSNVFSYVPNIIGSSRRRCRR
jgi:mechanosensitive ion channel-like protein